MNSRKIFLPTREWVLWVVIGGLAGVSAWARAYTSEPVKQWEDDRERAVRGYQDNIQQTIEQWKDSCKKLIMNWKEERDQANHDFLEGKEKFLKLWKNEQEIITRVWKEKGNSTVLLWKEYGVNYCTQLDFESGNIKSSGIVLLEKEGDLHQAREKAYRIALLKIRDQILSLKPTNRESLKEAGEKYGTQMEEKVDEFISRNVAPQLEAEKVEVVENTNQKLVRVEVATSMVQEDMNNLIKPLIEKEASKGEKFVIDEKETQAMSEKLNREGPYTGLLIDARGIGLLPCLAPEIITPDGRRIYGISIASEAYISKTGLVGWTKTVNPARVNIRIGEKPLLIKARKVLNQNQIVVAKEDANLIYSADVRWNFLLKGRVVVAVD